MCLFSQSYAFRLRLACIPLYYICLLYYAFRVSWKIQGVVEGFGSSPICCFYLGGGVQSLRGWKGAYSLVSFCWISYVVQNCQRTFQFISHYAAIYKPLLVKSIWVILLVSTLVNSQSLAVRWLQKSSIQRTVYIGHPYIQCGVIYGTFITYIILLFKLRIL